MLGKRKITYNSQSLTLFSFLSCITCLAILKNQNLESCTGAKVSAKGFKTGTRKGKLTEIKVKMNANLTSQWTHFFSNLWRNHWSYLLILTGEGDEYLHDSSFCFIVLKQSSAAVQKGRVIVCQSVSIYAKCATSYCIHCKSLPFPIY